MAELESYKNQKHTFLEKSMALSKAILRSKLASRIELPALQQKAQRLHALLLEKRDPGLLPKRFVTAIKGYSPIQYFVVASLSMRQGPQQNDSNEKWCLGLRVQEAVDDANIGILEVFQGIFGDDGWILQGTMPELSSLTATIDWLWETPWFSNRSQAPEDFLRHQLDHWLELVEMIPVLNTTP